MACPDVKTLLGYIQRNDIGLTRLVLLPPHHALHAARKPPRMQRENTDEEKTGYDGISRHIVSILWKKIGYA